MIVVERAFFVLVALAFAGCRPGEDEPVEPPSEEEVRDLADRQCEQHATCLPGVSEEETAEQLEECKENQAWLPARLYGDQNAECKDLWLVIDYNECKASLGCEDYLGPSEDPDSPCLEQLMAVHDAECSP
jgi:hypothetical protein